MRRWEKALVGGLLLASVVLFVLGVAAARAYTGAANVTTAALSDMRVNPSQAVTWVPGPVLNATGLPVGGGNSSLSFDGVNQYVTLGDVLDFDAADSFSISVWLKPNAVDRRFAISKGGTDGGAAPENNGYDLGTYASRILSRLQDADSFVWVGFDGPVRTIGVLYHATLVANRDTNKAQFYVNGVTSGSEVNIITIGDLANARSLYVGSYSINPAYCPFDGIIDEVRVYNRALSPTEVTQHYQGVYLDETGLVLYLDFDGQALDQSGNGNDGTLQNGPAYTDGWASVPVSTLFNGTLSVASRRILVNSTDGTALSTIPDTAPATWGNYTATLAPDTSIGNATAAPFLVDTFTVDLHAVYGTVPTSLPATVYAQAYSLLDGDNLTDADTLAVSGYAFTWNTYTDRFETQITKTTPQSYTLSAVTALSEATYGITNGTVSTPVTVTVVQRGSSLIYQYLPVGDIGGLIFSVYTQALNIQVTWLIIMLIGSVFLYRRLGAIPTALIWLLSWGGFVAVFPPVAINLAVGMLLFGVASLIFLAFFYWRRSTS